MIESGKKAFKDMKTCLTAGMVVALLSVGCSTPAPLPPKISVGLDGLRSEGVSLRGQIEKTVGALNELMTKPQANFSPQFESFSQELGVLEARVEQTRQQRVATETVVKDQFMEWDENLKQLKSEESRAQAAARRSATEATYSDIQQKIADVKKEWTPFITDLRDVRQYLKDDLSKEGLQTIKPTAERVFDRKTNLINRLDVVIEALNNAMKRG